MVLGLVAHRATGNSRVGWIIAVSALLTPWLFQIGRLVFEVALFPLVLGVVLLLVQQVSTKLRWSPWEIGALGAALGLLTYTYTIGRLLGPLLAFGLALFVSRSRLPSIVATWIVFGLVLMPALLFNLSASGALASRAELLGYITPGMSLVDIGATSPQPCTGQPGPAPDASRGRPEHSPPRPSDGQCPRRDLDPGNRRSRSPCTRALARSVEFATSCTGSWSRSSRRRSRSMTSTR